MEEEDEDFVVYVTGDATKPKFSTGKSAIIVWYGDINYWLILCSPVDNSGKWSPKGFFASISRLSTAPQEAYQLAKSMEDIHVGDCHLIPIPKDNDDDGTHFV